ncbi:complement factor H-like isoform X1 [Xyrichtys novacula]|uniref:Complement factor H-like isoform X1 n=1 Tax=Xyrichtys novacula TaxID=13765 RepID=A0AAV1FK71_XYRNO|nr:complement factor H-like isoform X1 [Xyrichtys novacula]
MRLSFILLFLQLWGNVKVSLSQEALCSDLPVVPNAHVSEDTRREEYPMGWVVNFACDIGYITSRPIKYACTNEGWFTSHQGNCYLRPCQLPDDTPNGYYEIIQGDDLVFGATIKYRCNSGYQMVSREDTRTCLVDRWTSHVPICEPISCEAPPANERMTIHHLSDDDGPIVANRFITFSCDQPGTYLNGSARLICGSDGQWDHAFPTCEDYTCTVGELHPQLNVTGLPAANETIKVGHTLQFHCNGEFMLSGPDSVKCVENGRWNYPLPTCSDQCTIPGIPQSVRVTSRLPSNRQVRPGEKIHFVCNTNRRGHILRGKATVECLVGGQWSDDFPTCGLPLGCGTPPPLDNGDTRNSVRPRYDHNERVEYICQKLHIPEGSAYKTCNNGEWTGYFKCLRPCTVDADVMRRHNIHFTWSSEEKLYAVHQGGLTFSCVKGKRPVDPQGMRQFCVDGEISVPICQ